MSYSFFDYAAKIKDVYLELDNFKFFHSPFGRDQPDERFIGRRSALNRIKMILKNSDTKSGAYLITGFRGMGKTSIVRKAIYDLNKEYREEKSRRHRKYQHVLLFFENIIYLILGWKAYPYLYNAESTFALSISIVISIILSSLLISSLLDHLKTHQTYARLTKFERVEIYLSQGEVKDIDVLRQITTQLLAKWRQNQHRGNISLRFDIRYTLKLFLMSTVEYLFFGYNKASTNKIQYKNILKELEYLKQRLNANLTASSETDIRPIVIAKRFSPFSFRSGNKSFLPKVKGKEIENELVQILFDIEKLRKPRDNKRTGLSQYFKNWFDNFYPQFDIPEFIFVIDELDKIEPNYNYSTDEQDALDISPDNSKGMFASEKIRHRQESIASLLANLKSFLNIAMAKFVFIGGREMYDASLADIADRDSFYSSIFHDIIYINSFFKDKIEIRSGVTRMTEAYLCSILIPDDFLQKEMQEKRKNNPSETIDEDWEKEKLFKLKYYYEYLLIVQARENETNQLKTPLPDELKELQTERLYKIIFLLQKLIIFLTYRSNGTPKKLTGLIEDYIVKGSHRLQRLKADSKAIVIENPEAADKAIEQRLFLCFKYNSQYEIGLTANLYRPYLIIHSRYLKALGDKLLFSNAFIMDHILKFHPFGFSWRNLELIPEIILINKEPNLRGFIADLIKFLSGTYLRMTVTGVNQFKFYNEMKNELEYVSKISDLSSAAFNFTLDESLLIKRHYRKKLEDALKSFDHFSPREKESRYLYSIGFIQNILGDLHYYDKEFDDALMYYYDASQYLDDCYSFGNMAKQRFVLLIQNQLKLGQTMEKIRSYNSAFSVYQQLTINLPLYLAEIVDKDEEHAPVNFEGIKPYRGLQQINKGYVAWLSLVEKQRFDGLTKVNLIQNREALEHLLELNNDQIDNGKESRTDRHRFSFLLGDYYNNVGSILYFKNKNFVGLCRNLAEAQPLHKAEQMPSLLHSDAAVSFSAFQYYFLSLVHFLDAVEEDLLAGGDKEEQWKNFSTFEKATALLDQTYEYATNANALYHFANLFSKLGDTALTFIKSKEQSVLNKKAFRLFTPDQHTNDLIPILKTLAKDLDASLDTTRHITKYYSINTVFLFYRIASVFYAKAGRSYSYAFQYKKVLYILKDHLVFWGKELPDNPLPSDQKPKENATKTKNDAQQNQVTNTPKTEVIDYLIKCISSSDPEIAKGLVTDLEEMAMLIVRTYTQSYEVSNRPQILKYRQIFGHGEEKRNNNLLYNNLASSHETREILVLTREIKLKLKRIRAKLNIFDKKEVEKLESGKQMTKTEEEKLKQLKLLIKKLEIPFKDHLSSPFTTISNKFVRMLELKYRCERNYFFLAHLLRLEFLFHRQEFTEETLPKGQKRLEDATLPDRSMPEEMKGKELVKFLIYDAIFCLFDVLKTQDIYGSSYMISHSYRANAHYKLANWCEALLNYRKLVHYSEKDEHHEQKKKREKERREEEDKLANLLGTDATYYLEPNYHNELAIKHYRAAIEMHTEGKAYKDRLHDMYFLEDDYNDNFYHFCAANERYRLNIKLIANKLKDLEKKVREGSIVYKYGNYE